MERANGMVTVMNRRNEHKIDEVNVQKGWYIATRLGEKKPNDTTVPCVDIDRSCARSVEGSRGKVKY